MKTKIIIIILLVVFIISTLFNISGIVRNIKLEQIANLDNTQEMDIFGQFTIAGTDIVLDRKPGEKQSEDLMIIVMVLIQFISICVFILDERKVSLPVIFIVVAVTLLPVRSVTLNRDTENQEVHHINIYNMEYITTENSFSFKFHSDY